MPVRKELVLFLRDVNRAAFTRLPRRSDAGLHHAGAAPVAQLIADLEPISAALDAAGSR